MYWWNSVLLLVPSWPCCFVLALLFWPPPSTLPLKGMLQDWLPLLSFSFGSCTERFHFIRYHLLLLCGHLSLSCPVSHAYPFTAVLKNWITNKCNLVCFLFPLFLCSVSGEHFFPLRPYLKTPHQCTPCPFSAQIILWNMLLNFSPYFMTPFFTIFS